MLRKRVSIPRRKCKRSVILPEHPLDTANDQPVWNKIDFVLILFLNIIHNHNLQPVVNLNTYGFLQPVKYGSPRFEEILYRIE